MSEVVPKTRVVKKALVSEEAREARKEQLDETRQEQRTEVVDKKRAASSLDWTALHADITALVKDKGCHPILVRLSWHDAGTFCPKSKNGGARACMQFPGTGEATYGCNAGLEIARDLLQPIKDKYADKISTSDLWAFAACVAIEAAGGPKVPFRSGRKDASCSKDSVPNGRLPDGDKDAAHIRDIFHRMEFSDQEIVALSGAHTLGACHKDRSGFEGNWTEEPLKFDNSFFVDIFEKKWEETTVEGTGNPQFKDAKGNMMLTTDIALKTDEKFAPFTKKYAENEKVFFHDFAEAFQKLQELGYSDDQLNVI